ncbi:DUF1127 domain-containing protein [Pontivivens insulae]|uniref:YjiS-like domain-containing protein n=1 Tax=Pontivivens insulae TaxID=1639689 RepID=A0A2R8A9R0_9RHOB|nr:DUF1127 domain-containing protein [Pontivivens insulae]RED12872.1 uncharacterized protein DUF1127 [Pontivivens insulae]SPF28963.1 hypothetical protein POI8812_01266 [Pontivivens insulae]
MQITLTLTLPDLPKRGVAALLKTWTVRARSRRHLARLEPHILRDIGLTDFEARTEAQRPFWFEQR